MVNPEARLKSSILLALLILVSQIALAGAASNPTYACNNVTTVLQPAQNVSCGPVEVLLNSLSQPDNTSISYASVGVYINGRLYVSWRGAPKSGQNITDSGSKYSIFINQTHYGNSSSQQWAQIMIGVLSVAAQNATTTIASNQQSVQAATVPAVIAILVVLVLVAYALTRRKKKEDIIPQQ